MATERAGFVGTCDVHHKKLFKTRKDARAAARAVHPGANLSAYKCDVPAHAGCWHYGHLPKQTVSRGVESSMSSRYKPEI
jgi:hypothetical protein